MNFLAYVGAVWLFSVGYVLAGFLAYAVLFRKAWSWDRVRLSTLWPVTLPFALVLWVRHRLRRSRRERVPKAQVRR